MRSPLGPPSHAQQARFRIIYQLGCLPCTLDGHMNVPCQVHHVLRGQRRVSHDHTYGNCPWHHNGERIGWAQQLPFCELDKRRPSLARTPRAYHERYGPEDFLVLVQNQLILKWLETEKSLEGVL